MKKNEPKPGIIQRAIMLAIITIAPGITVEASQSRHHSRGTQDKNCLQESAPKTGSWPVDY